MTLPFVSESSGLLLDNGWLHGVVIGLVVLGVALGIVAYVIWFERKFTGLMHQRPGPNVVGWAGLLQPIADVLKLFQKDDTLPSSADRVLFLLAPPLMLGLTMMTLVVVPWGWGVIVADLHLGVLFALSISSLIVLPIWMAGWASNNKYALLGAMRAAAQSISYEIPLLLAATVPVVLTGSFRLGDIVQAQAGLKWFALWPPGPGLLAFVLFYLASLAEANRIPFDIPEAESELVSGISTEYGGMKFALFYLGEYLHTLVAGAMGAALFLGGADMGPLGSGPHWMLLKTLLLTGSVVFVRWSLLRYRADQLMAMCWTWFVPASLGLVMVSALWVHLT